MEILGVGPLELFFILIIALIVLGPNDMAKAGRTMGRFLRKIVMSPEWRTIRQASQEIRQLPTRMIREAGLEEMRELEELKRMSQPQVLRKELGLEEFQKEVNVIQSDLADWTTPPRTIQPPPEIESDTPDTALEDDPRQQED